MGNDNNKNGSKKQVNIQRIKFYPIQLPPKLDQKVRKLFSLIDVDGSETIDREETLRFWSSNFAKINSKVLFDQVDKNNDGTIQLEEWVEFWRVVYESGYSEEEVCNELDNMIKGGSWVKFETNKKIGEDKNKKLKSKGKW